MYTQLHFRNVNICLEAPGTLPDLPGWILGHPIEVENKSTFCQKAATVRGPALLATEVIICFQCGEIIIQHRICHLRRLDHHSTENMLSAALRSSFSREYAQKRAPGIEPPKVKRHVRGSNHLATEVIICPNAAPRSSLNKEYALCVA